MVIPCGSILNDWLQVFPSSFSIAALIGAAAIRGRVQASKLRWGEDGRGEAGRRRKLSEDEEDRGGVEAKRPRRDDDEEQEEDEEEGASPPRQVEACSPTPLLAARRLLRDPKELLAIATEERRGEVAPARFNLSFNVILVLTREIPIDESRMYEALTIVDQVKLLATGRSCLWPRDKGALAKVLPG